MSEQTQFQEPIHVIIPGVKRQNFRSLEDVIEWKEDELNTWNSFWEKVSSEQVFGLDQNLLNGARNELNQIQEHISQYQSNNDQAHRQTHRDQIAARMEKYSKRTLVTTEPDFEDIIKLAESNSDVALFKFARLAGQVIPANQIPDMIRFAQTANAVGNRDIDPEKAVASQKQRLRNLEKKIDEHVEQSHHDFHSLLESIRSDKRRLKSIYLELGHRYRKLLLTHDTKMEQMETAFSTEMQLRAAEKFWSHKRRLNRKREKVATANLYKGIGVASAVLVILYGAIGYFAPAENVPLLIFLLVVPTILAVWPLRLLANQVRSNKEMADDAEEREAMVLTFKALEFEGRVGDDERLVILSALFRPHEKGGEDSIPHPIMEAVIKRLGSSS